MALKVSVKDKVYGEVIEIENAETGEMLHSYTLELNSAEITRIKEIYVALEKNDVEEKKEKEYDEEVREIFFNTHRQKIEEVASEYFIDELVLKIFGDVVGFLNLRTHQTANASQIKYQKKTQKIKGQMKKST